MTAVRVWAPSADSVTLRHRRSDAGADAPWQREAMEPTEGGWFEVDAGIEVGSDYGFVLDDSDELLADPRSRRQPEGLFGPSRWWVDEEPWHDDAWRGRDLPGAVLYELHVGTFTPEGTFDGAIGRLGHLVDLGVTHIELLPLNDFDGRWNWGYDGVLWYAVHEAYGGPDGLHRFVDQAHRLGLAVVLDVVYNHLGAAGNVLPRFGPYLQEATGTWGELVNLDGPGAQGVRDHILDNATGWLEAFHLDGLRIDAIHALRDRSPVHLLAELSERVTALERRLGRPLSLIAESDLNDPAVVTDVASGGLGMTAQWDDDVHHALHASLTGERQGYYVDFGSLEVLAKALTTGFVHDGSYSTFRGRPHGKPIPKGTPGWRFVVYLQDHDQVGNRAAGERLSALAPIELVKVGAVLLLTSPFTPMLWMGEEWAASTPWPFFSAHEDPDVAAAVGPGRVAEFEGYGWDTDQMPEPEDPKTYASAVLDWNEVGAPGHAELFELYRSLIALRRSNPGLADAPVGSVALDVEAERSCIIVRRDGFLILANLSSEAHELEVDATSVELSTGATTLGNGTVVLAPRTAAVLRRAPTTTS